MSSEPTLHPVARGAAHLDVLEVRCGRCDRHARLRVDRLLAQDGPDAPVGAVLRALVGRLPEPRRSRAGSVRSYVPKLLEFFGTVRAPE